MLIDGKALRHLDKETLLSFINVYEEREMYPYYNQILYCKLSSNGSYKYKIFDINEDKVIVLYKDVKFINVKYIRLTGYPISISGNRQSEDMVFDMLSKDVNVKEMYISERELEYIDHIETNGLQICDLDFYSYIPTRALEINKSKWKSKYRINKYGKDLAFRLAKKEDYEEIEKLHETWKDSKDDVRSRKLFKGFFRNYDNLVGEDLVYVLTYKSHVIGFALLDDINNGIKHMSIQQYYTIHYAPSHILNEDTDALFRHIGQIFYYFMTMEMNSIGCDTLSVAGSVHLDGTLVNYKNNVHKSKLTYFKYLFKR